MTDDQNTRRYPSDYAGPVSFMTAAAMVSFVALLGAAALALAMIAVDAVRGWCS